MWITRPRGPTEDTSEAARRVEQRNIWPYLAGQMRVAPQDWQALLATAGRFRRFVRPHLLEYLLPELPIPVDTRRHQLQARYLRGAYRDVLHDLARIGVETLTIKGYANAFTLYPDPDLRVMGDLDVIVAENAAWRAGARLRQAGFQPAQPHRPRRGTIAEHSYQALTDPTRDINIDLHTQANMYPLPLALDRPTLFADATWSEAAATNLPRREHTALILISHQANDRFGPKAVKRMLDVLRLLPSGPYPADWAEVWSLARCAHLGKPTAVTLALLERLGIDTGPLPGAVRAAVRSAHRISRLESLARSWVALFPEGERRGSRKVHDDIVLACEPPTLAYRYARRFGGWVRPGSRMPPGF